ncbi:hypothetical protein [Brevundimonas terrae]|uniref:hypothetical protein n=1 Tax=Brevundimonas terrae TaxID=363631 RepID=UPI0014237600|nr:hypothetical protein [Brevundimonas terrae]NIJ25286.1 hypothetical protein [Brevundimonas terrae]
MKKTDLRRALGIVREAGVDLVSLDLLPSGTMRLNFVELSADKSAEPVDEEVAAWDAALA